MTAHGCGGGTGGTAGRCGDENLDKVADTGRDGGAGTAADRYGLREVFVARHCQYRYADGRLTEQGLNEAAGIAVKLRDRNIELILHSPIARCEETARLVWEGLGRKPRMASAEWLHEDAMLDQDWRGRLADGNVLLITHSPVIRQLTSAPGASICGEVTEIR